MKLRLAALSLNQTPLDWAGNVGRLRRGLDEARSAGAHVVCCPELALSGYGAEDAFLWPSTADHSLRALGQVLPHTRGLVAALGLPLRYEGHLHNAVALAVDGKLVGLGCKRHLAGDGIHYEPRWFRPWPRGVATEVQLSLGAQVDIRVPIGDWVFEVGGLRMGFEICEDAWVAERPGAELCATGVDLILNPSASHFAFGKHAYRRTLVETGSREFRAAYVYANLLGNEAGRSIYDGDGLIAAGGRILASNRRFCFGEHSLVCADVAFASASGSLRAESFSNEQPAAERLPEKAGAVLVRPLSRTDFAFTPLKSPVPATSAEAGLLDKAEEFGRAVALGLFDYARKSRSRGYVVSLSGGADSAACALLVALMVRWASLERGLESVAELLGQDAAVQGGDRTKIDSERALVRAVLTTVYQSTEHSGNVTRAAAQGLANSLGADHHEFDVDPLFRIYRELGEQALGRELAFPRDDIALQNLQARCRAPSVWLLANVRGALLLSTSNRSEAAVGYATMDGDTAGGLAPIAGIDKDYLRRWLVLMEHTGLPEFGRCDALAAINVQAPTAELRPAQYAQTDEADLMPYDVLNVAEAAFVSERGGPREVLAKLVERFPEHERSELVRYTRRFFVLFTRNQWKRERYAPSFHLDDRSLDPKTWCRFPILSGGFAEDLEGLE
jgi:NAD+ synthase (glutamine-hydrolysing)